MIDAIRKGLGCVLKEEREINFEDNDKKKRKRTKKGNFLTKLVAAKIFMKG